MDQLDLLLKLVIASYVVLFITCVVFTVMEYRKWRFPAWVMWVSILLSVDLFLMVPVLFYAEQRIIRQRKLNERIATLKIATGWFIFAGSMLTSGVFTYLCRMTVDRTYSDELATVCSGFVFFLVMLFLFWLNSKFDAMLGVSRKNPLQPEQ